MESVWIDEKDNGSHKGHFQENQDNQSPLRTDAQRILKSEKQEVQAHAAFI